MSIRMCWRGPVNGMVTMPGVFSPTEALAAIAAGASALKFFPASVIGAAGIKAISAVLPADTIIGAVGGISELDFETYARNGIRLFGLGSSIFPAGHGCHRDRDARPEDGRRMGRRCHRNAGGLKPMEAPRKQTLGVCYYPEHWPQERWATDAQMMVEAGITHVRIGEFAWSRIEPEPGHYDWGWLDRAFETLAAHGLGVVLGTPTATPPKWLVDFMPDMLAVERTAMCAASVRAAIIASAIWAIAANARASSPISQSAMAATRRSSPGRLTTNMAAMTRWKAIRLPRSKASATGWRRNTSRPTR
jgi:hypothetical protein